MLKFETKDKELLIWVNGLTKTPESLTQEELAQLQKSGDTRVTDSKVKKEVPEVIPA
jgi:succinate dehydrogenase flavin-adding protein (antitoxin of CptAB toxin-antitoxin module)